MITIRPIQTAWIDSISAAFRTAPRVCAQAPTAFGKTVCFAEIVRRTLLRGNRVVIMAHRIEIIYQIGDALRTAGVRFGWIEPARLMQDEMCMIGMVQTIANRLDKVTKPTLLVVDECHHAVSGSYRKICEAWAGCFVLGVTATPQRLDGRGLKDAFDALVPGPSVRELINLGYLSDYVYFHPPTKLDLSAVQTRAGDYAIDQLAEAMDRSAITGDAVDTYRKRLDGRPALVFCASVLHAQHVAEQFTMAGWRAASVDGATDRVMRKDRIAAIGDGRLQVLTSCDIISEGTDIPVVAGALLLRPTKSLTVFVQQIGRVLRPKPDLSKAVILDHVGNVANFGLPDQEREWSLEGRRKRQPTAAVRQCTSCWQCFPPAPVCPGCGFVFPVKERAAKPKERAGELVEAAPETFGTREYWLKKAPLKELLRQARTIEQLREIAAARGYKPGWAWQIMQFRERALSASAQSGGQAA